MLERQNDRIAVKPTNAFLIEGGLQVFATAASMHAAALQKATMIAAYDTVSTFEDELQTLDTEIERWRRAEGSPERQSYLDSAPAKPKRSRLKMVKKGNQITWVIETVK